jgi:hypothetical protein
VLIFESIFDKHIVVHQLPVESEEGFAPPGDSMDMEEVLQEVLHEEGGVVSEAHLVFDVFGEGGGGGGVEGFEVVVGGFGEQVKQKLIDSGLVVAGEGEFHFGNEVCVREGGYLWDSCCSHVSTVRQAQAD